MIGKSPKYDSLRVLVLEDEAHIRRLIDRLLRQIGFESIYLVADGIDGMKELLRIHPDLIICDVHMEPMGGMKFLQTLRSIRDASLSGLPVIFLTADAEVDTVMQAKELRVDGYIAKPVSLTQLKTKIDVVLAEYQAREMG